MNIPNLLSAVRLIAAPFLLYLAWTERPVPFLILLTLALLSDAVDGFLARRRHTASALGSRLDSWGDLATFLVVPVCAWWLWPETIRREAGFVAVALAAYLIPPAAGLLKFGCLTSYHVWSAKAAAVLMGAALLVLFITDIAWPFRGAVVLLCLSAAEELAITLRLSAPRDNVRSYWHVTGRERTGGKDRRRP